MERQAIVDKFWELRYMQTVFTTSRTSWKVVTAILWTEMTGELRKKDATSALQTTGRGLSQIFSTLIIGPMSMVRTKKSETASSKPSSKARRI